MNTGLVKQERRDPCWQDNLTHCSSQQVCWWQHLHLRLKFLHKKIYCTSTKNEWKGYHNKIVWSEFVLMQDSWRQLRSDSWQQRAGNLRDAVRRILRWNRMHVLLQAGQMLKQNHKRRISASSFTKTFPIGERTWTDIEPQDYSPTDYSVLKKLINLLRHGSLPREEDGAIEFWRLNDDHRNKFEHSQYRSDDMWKSKMAGGGGNKNRFQYCTDPSGQEILYLRALQGHSGRNLIGLTLQDNVLIPNNFFEYIYHIGCAINLHSITNSGLILGGQNLGKEKQTVFFTAVNPVNKEHKDPYKIDLTAPRLAWKRGKDIKTRCIGSKNSLLNGKDWSSIKQDRTQSSFTTHSQLLVARKLLWRNLEKSYTRCMRHLDSLQRFPWNMIGWRNWIQKLLEAAKTPNESNQNKKPNYQERGDPWVSNHQVRSLRR